MFVLQIQKSHSKRLPFNSTSKQKNPDRHWQFSASQSTSRIQIQRPESRKTPHGLPAFRTLEAKTSQFNLAASESSDMYHIWMWTLKRYVPYMNACIYITPAHTVILAIKIVIHPNWMRTSVAPAQAATNGFCVVCASIACLYCFVEPCANIKVLWKSCRGNLLAARRHLGRDDQKGLYRARTLYKLKMKINANNIVHVLCLVFFLPRQEVIEIKLNTIQDVP